MPWDPDLQTNNQIHNNPYTANGYEKAKLRKLLLIVVGVLMAIVLLALIVHFARPESQQDKYTKSATAAARKQIPDAKVRDVKVAGGFAIATVSDPAGGGQASAGSTTVFRVNKDGSMVQLAKGSSFGPIDLLELGMPLATQARLTGTNIGHVEQNLAKQCGSDDYDEIGFNGFGGSFSPGQWQIDAGTLDILMQKLSRAISAQNIKAMGDKAVICVNATQKNSNFTTDKTTYISTYTLQVQFITGEGTLTMHTVTFTNSSPRYRIYTLDGQDI